jgi:carbamoyl-phosphate synthase large subunit
MAVKDNEVYVIEINPRASRTVPFISKATGVPLAKLAARVSVGQTLDQLDLTVKQKFPQWCAVKEAVFPFNRFSGVDPVLGPEMKSTGEVMGIDTCFELAYWKSQIAAGQILPAKGTVFLSARDADKEWMAGLARKLHELEFSIVATEGTAEALKKVGLEAEVVHKLAEKISPNILDFMKQGRIDLVINTPSGILARSDEVLIRSEAILRSIPIVTTRDGAEATVAAIHHMIDRDWTVHALQDFYA